MSITIAFYMNRKFAQVEPSMIAADWARFGDEAFLCAKAGIKIIHLDVMDGLFVPNLSMGPDMVLAIKKSCRDLILDVHLMIYSPDRFIETFAESGADEITFHFEATEDIEYVKNYIKKCNKKVGIAIKPETSETLLVKYLDNVDKILIMTVEPGFGGRKFLPDMLKKVRFLRSIGFNGDIQVDGGIDLKSGEESILAGANRLVSGTYFFNQSDRAMTVRQFNILCEKFVQ